MNPRPCANDCGSKATIGHPCCKNHGPSFRKRLEEERVFGNGPSKRRCALHYLGCPKKATFGFSACTAEHGKFFREIVDNEKLPITEKKAPVEKKVEKKRDVIASAPMLDLNFCPNGCVTITPKIDAGRCPGPVECHHGHTAICNKRVFSGSAHDPYCSKDCDRSHSLAYFGC